MSTQPEESGAGVRFLSSTYSSTLRLWKLRLTARSSAREVPERMLEGEAVEEELAIIEAAMVFAFGFPDMLPMRSLGTRVWIFCSRFRTRALISETI